jgi:hypothetical protein
MRTRPHFFDSVRSASESLWEQIERNQELGGAWWLLFRQVQNPRHILSELLQNADDAGATEASVSTEGGWFIFRHNGHDFTEDEFRSLCRFGFSNKRRLLTIGVSRDWIQVRLFAWVGSGSIDPYDFDQVCEGALYPA